MLATANSTRVGSTGWEDPDPNYRAVHGAVRVYQAALNREIEAGILIDGVFGPKTQKAVTAWQKTQPPEHEISVWGGIGQSSSKWLLMPLLKAMVPGDLQNAVCGLVTQESSWDAGAVGFVDEDDLGLVQINGPANPDFDEKERLRAKVAFEYAANILDTRREDFGNLRDAVASYNLGAGGCRAWIAAGRPDLWTPSDSATPRNVRKYIDTILNVCAQ